VQHNVDIPLSSDAIDRVTTFELVSTRELELLCRSYDSSGETGLPLVPLQPNPCSPSLIMLFGCGCSCYDYYSTIRFVL